MSNENIHKGTLLAEAYPSADQWKQLVKAFSSDSVAHKLLLAHVPYVFRNEPAKYAVFRRIMADSFDVQPTDVFIVGSAMAGRSLKGRDIDKVYSPESDIDTLIISAPLFTTLLMQSLEWVRGVTRSQERDAQGKRVQPQLDADDIASLHKLSDNACKGIWRPDSLPKGTPARESFFARFERVSLHTLGLQLSEDTVARVNGRVARSFEDAVSDLANSIYKLRLEFDEGKSRATNKSKSIVRTSSAAESEKRQVAQTPESNVETDSAEEGQRTEVFNAAGDGKKQTSAKP